MTVKSFYAGRIPIMWLLPVFFLIVLASIQPVTAQSSIEQTAVRAKAASQPVLRNEGTIRVFAVMVDFQPDNNRFTTGNGTFDPDFLKNPNIPITIDPTPHDAGHFGAHLDFMKEYYERVSNGKLQIEWQIYPEVLRMPNTMDAYSPLGQDGSQDGKIFDLLQDTWTALARNGGFDFSDYDEDRDAFILFHAGVGRDINFLGTSLDRTPQDIPSLYMSLDAMRKFGQAPNFQGFGIPNQNGDVFRIRNTLILPETESRPGTDVTGTPFVLQLGINGLLTATMGNHLGLPDLYNTLDGSSAIGKFGLMDGSGFFSYFGMFPPEPSAWEKVYMGWVDPVTVDPTKAGTFTLPAVSLRQPNSIYKIPISRDEYYLVENRHRDTKGDGVLIKVRTPSGSIVERRLPIFDDLFGSTSADSLQKLLPAGVVVSVDNFDWSLPGGVDPGVDGRYGTADDRRLDGGILIWHIDESVLRSKGYGSGVNNNPLRKGVDLVEADGSQDIGFKTNNQFLAGFVNGTAFDFWWSGNDARVITASNREIQLYQNRFGPDTTPAAVSNSGAKATFELYDFSDNLPVARFSIRPVPSTTIVPVSINAQLEAPAVNRPLTEDPFPFGLAIHHIGQDTILIAPGPSRLDAIGISNSVRNLRQTITGTAPQQPLIIDNRLFVAPKSSGQIPAARAFQFANGSYSQLWQTTETGSSTGFLSQSAIGVLDFDLGTRRVMVFDGASLTSYPQSVQWSSQVAGRRFEFTQTTLRSNDGVLDWVVPNTGGFKGYAAAFQPEAGASAAALIYRNDSWRILSDRHSQTKIINEGSLLGWPAMVDWDGDGRVDFIGVNESKNQLDARNHDGGSLNGFPLQAPKGSRFVGTPLVATLSGESQSMLLIAAVDSLSMVILGYDQQLRPLAGFPLLVGSMTSPIDHPIHPVLYGKTLFAAAPNGEIKAWRFPDIDRVEWASRYGAFVNAKVTGPTIDHPLVIPGAALLDAEETYNWPNPAKDITHVRFRTSRAATVEIRLITQDGKTVFSTVINTPGGLSTDVPIQTERLGNGVYYANIKATSDGDSESRTIKIAVIH
jgi:hypothetical protein